MVHGVAQTMPSTSPKQAALANALKQPEPERLTFLPHPYGTLKSEGRGSVMSEGIDWKNWIAPKVLSDAMRAVTAPKRAWTGELDPNSQEGVQEAMNVGLTTMAPDLGRVVLAKRLKVPQGQLGMNVYHGSPHKFDAFDASKIGTGEGAQAYGHGLYLAENADVAKNYAPRDFKYEEKLMRMYKTAELNRNYNAMEVLESAMMHQTPNELRTQYPKAGRLIDSIAKEQSKANFSLYKVDLPDEMIPKMLDWDKPLSQQPESVRKVLSEVLTGNTVKENLSGERLVAELHKELGEKGTADFMRNAGIPGIRYLDQGSRTAGQGTYNYVVFPGEEKALKILGRE